MHKNIVAYLLIKMHISIDQAYILHTYTPSTYKHTYLHTYNHTYVHTYIQTYMHACMHAYIDTYISTITYIHTR